MGSERRKLTVVDRATIALRLGDGWGIRRIALAIGRSPGTVSGEIGRNGGGLAYEAGAAASRAEAQQALTGRKPRMQHDGALFGGVAELLRRGWSPEQISGRRKREEAGVEQVSGL